MGNRSEYYLSTSRQNHLSSKRYDTGKILGSPKTSVSQGSLCLQCSFLQRFDTMRASFQST